MASCKNCGKSVGCGCNLNRQGLCPTCAQKANEPVTIVPQVPLPTPTQDYKLGDNKWLI